MKSLAAASKSIFSTSIIHQVVIDKNRKTLFTSNQLSAFIDDIIVFTSMNLDDTVTQATLNWSCQAQVVLSVVNFFRLMYSYLITTQNSAWFYSSSHQQNCALDDSNQRTFSLNSSDQHLINVSTTLSDSSTVSMNFSKASDMIWTDYDDSTDLALTATSSLSISLMNFSIWAINVSSATA